VFDFQFEVQKISVINQIGWSLDIYTENSSILNVLSLGCKKGSCQEQFFGSKKGCGSGNATGTDNNGRESQRGDCGSCSQDDCWGRGSNCHCDEHEGDTGDLNGLHLKMIRIHVEINQMLAKGNE